MVISLWDQSAEEADFSAALEGDAEADVAIVGGGFTGLSTALHAAERGMSAHVIEAEQIGYGGSGRNAGLLNAGLWTPPEDIAETMGKAPAARVVALLGRAPAYVMDLIEKHQIRCELTRTGTIHAAHAPSGLSDLRRRAGQWQRLGAPVDLLSREETARLVGTDVFHGGLLDRRAGTINPMGYVRGLARAARGAGATISTGTKAERLTREGGKWVVQTNRGRITAPHVVLGTNAYTGELWPGLKQTFTLIHYFQVATKPLGERGAHILPERQGIWDTAPIMTSVRRDGFGRLIVGSMGQTMGGLSHRFARRRIERLFPGLGPVEFDEAWFGQLAMTPDHLPRIHRLAEGLYTPIAYNGRGIAPGTVFGKAMAELIAGGSEADLPLPVTDLAPVPATESVKSRFYQLAFAVNQVWKGL